MVGELYTWLHEDDSLRENNGTGKSLEKGNSCELDSTAYPNAKHEGSVFKSLRFFEGSFFDT